MARLKAIYWYGSRIILPAIIFTLWCGYFLYSAQSQSDVKTLRPMIDSIEGLRASLDQLRFFLIAATAGGSTEGSAVARAFAFKSSATIPENNSVAVNTSSSKPLMSREDTNSPYESFEQELVVHLWIDVPNAFSWRKCLFKYVNRIITIDCKAEEVDQSWRVRAAKKENNRIEGFRLENKAGECAVPLAFPGVKETWVGLTNCSYAVDQQGFWRWRKDARLEWSGGGCLASQGGQKEVRIAECDDSSEDQILEFGVVLANQSIGPLMPAVWEARQTRLRNQELIAAKVEVDLVLEEIAAAERSGELTAVTGSRRAVVFYLDGGSGFLSYLTWWLFTWKAIGLDAAEEEFDIILMAHPDSIDKLPPTCQALPPDFDPRKIEGPGRCLYRIMVGIAERDHRYDHYLNSQECLVNKEQSGFLRHYKLLMRADLDTFPTPRMIGFWPSDIICNRNAVTNHGLDSINNAIKEAAKAAGIEHKGWHDTDSAWFGPARRVIALAKLTTHLNRFTRAHMFGPGTACRCATCTALPEKCQWSKGPYAGTLLLYSQEIAMNRIWTQREFDEQTGAILDVSCTDEKASICEPALLHARHNAHPFSKFTFLRGGYRDYDMADLDITNLRDYAMYMANASHMQGKNASLVMEKYRQNVGEAVPLSQLCSKNPPHLAKYPRRLQRRSVSQIPEPWGEDHTMGIHPTTRAATLLNIL